MTVAGLLRCMGPVAGLRAWFALLGMAAIVLPMLPTQLSHASEEASTHESGIAMPYETSLRLRATENHRSAHVWTWPEGNKAYVVRYDSTGLGQRIEMFDLRGGESLNVASLSPPATANPTTSGTLEHGNEQILRVDRAKGRLFVATGTNLNDDPARHVAARHVCAHPHALEGMCVTGLSVLDAATLEKQSWIALPAVETDGKAVAPHLGAMEFVAGEAPGEPDRVLMVVYDLASQQQVQPELNPRRLGPTLTYLISFDVDRGVVEWMVRVDACRGARVWSVAGQFGFPGRMPHEMAVMLANTPSGRSAVVGCRLSATALTGVVAEIPLDSSGRPSQLPLSAAMPTPSAQEPRFGGETGGTPVVIAPSPRTIVGPDQVWEIIADPQGGRLLFRVVDGSPLTEVWFVYDAGSGQFVGTIGIGRVTSRWADSMSGLDEDTGRLYVATNAGLFLADTRRSPVAQALRFPPSPDFSGGGQTPRALSAVPAAGALPPRFLYAVRRTSEGVWREMADPVPRSVDPPFSLGQPSADVEETEGATAAVFDGAARGFGARILMVGGLEGATRAGPVDPTGAALQFRDAPEDVEDIARPGHGFSRVLRPVIGDSPCTVSNREVMFSVVGVEGPSIVDANGGRATAQPLVIDSGTSGDAEAPVSRCASREWDALFATALLGHAPADEPSAAALTALTAAECGTAAPSGEVGGSIWPGSQARVNCEDEEAGGFSYVRGGTLGDVAIAESLASFRVYRDPGRGIVARVESVARGISLAGVLRIDTVRGTAESWANGRRRLVPESSVEKPYDPNCDIERSAGTCFTPHVFGVRTAAYSCGPCGNEDELAERLSRALGAYGSVRLRKPDPVLARGAENGSLAAVTKPTSERFSDLVLNQDLLQTVLPTLEIIRHAPPNRNFTGGGPRGRQIYQFGGVEASSTYVIQCLLKYDEDRRSCDAPSEPHGSLTITLRDPEGAALAGGGFQLYSDGDGVLGLGDRMVDAGACLTSEDGVGNCRFDRLLPGGYLVQQVQSPPGFARVDELLRVQIDPAQSTSAVFTNASNLSAVQLHASDHAGQPLVGATFHVYVDWDNDGKVAVGDGPFAECVTDTRGRCEMRLPPGSYILVQRAAHAGLLPVNPVPFVFVSGGQTAKIDIVNHPAGTSSDDGTRLTVVEQDRRVPSPTTSPLGQFEPPGRRDSTSAARPVVEPVGGTVVRVLRLPRDVLTLVVRGSREAIAWLATLALLAVGIAAVRRRSMLAGLTLSAGAALGRGCTLPMPATRRRGERSSRPPEDGQRLYATALVERPVVVAGGASPLEAPSSVEVVVAVASPALSACVSAKLTESRPLRPLRLVRSVDSVGELRQTLLLQKPDVLVLDLTIRTGTAEDMCASLVQMFPPARTLGLLPQGRTLRPLAERAAASGFGGLLAIDDDIRNGQLAYAIRCVASGKPFYGPSVQAVLLDEWSRGRAAWRASRLTAREREIATLMAQGASRKDIAEQLFLSEQTVKMHARAVRAKLGLSGVANPAQVRARLLEEGLAPD